MKRGMDADKATDVRDGRMDKVQVTGQVGGNGVFEGPDGVRTGTNMGEGRELGSEKIVCLSDCHVHRDPVSSRRGRSRLESVGG